MNNIPLYRLHNLTEQEGDTPGVFFLDRKIDRRNVPIDIPYRRDFYAVGICLGGRAELKANLETYVIEEDCLMAKPPFTINQWTRFSDDFETLTIFFTRDFITAHNSLHLDSLRFFDMGANHVVRVTQQQSRTIVAFLQLLHDKYRNPQPYRDQIVRNLLNSLLYEMAALFLEHSNASGAVQTRSQRLAAEFKQLVGTHFKTERSLSFYAARLFITPKYLTETVREATGRTAGGWIAEAVVLEAKVLLQDPSLSIAQVSALLCFPDPSTFARFFRRAAGISPTAYKLAL